MEYQKSKSRSQTQTQGAVPRPYMAINLHTSLQCSLFHQLNPKKFLCLASGVARCCEVQAGRRPGFSCLGVYLGMAVADLRSVRAPVHVAADLGTE